jgi:lysylphosphatidylglycerol synthetase-like protein (DUF2156 family)
MRYQLFAILQEQLEPWIELSLATIEAVRNRSESRARERFNAALGKINFVPIMQSFYEFLDDLPLWFY